MTHRQHLPLLKSSLPICTTRPNPENWAKLAAQKAAPISPTGPVSSGIRETINLPPASYTTILHALRGTFANHCALVVCLKGHNANLKTDSTAAETTPVPTDQCVVLPNKSILFPKNSLQLILHIMTAPTQGPLSENPFPEGTNAVAQLNANTFVMKQASH